MPYAPGQICCPCQDQHCSREWAKTKKVCFPAPFPLPARQPTPLYDPLAPFPPPEQTAAEPHVITMLAGRNRTITEDPMTGDITVTVHRERASYYLPAIDLGFEADAEEHYRIREGDASATTAETRATWRLSRGGWRTRTETFTRVSCTTGTFEIEASRLSRANCA